MQETVQCATKLLVPSTSPSKDAKCRAECASLFPGSNTENRKIRTT